MQNLFPKHWLLNPFQTQRLIKIPLPLWNVNALGIWFLWNYLRNVCYYFWNNIKEEVQTIGKLFRYENVLFSFSSNWLWKITSNTNISEIRKLQLSCWTLGFRPVYTSLFACHEGEMKARLSSRSPSGDVGSGAGASTGSRAVGWGPGRGRGGVEWWGGWRPVQVTRAALPEHAHTLTEGYFGVIPIHLINIHFRSYLVSLMLLREEIKYQ